MINNVICAGICTRRVQQSIAIHRNLLLIVDNVKESLSIGVAGRNRRSIAIRRHLSLIIPGRQYYRAIVYCAEGDFKNLFWVAAKKRYTLSDWGQKQVNNKIM